MGKDKLRRFAEMETFSNVIQPSLDEVLNKDYCLKGKWYEEFNRKAPLVLELACGKGEFTVAGALKDASKNYIGIDIKGNRMHRGAKFCLENNLTHARFLRTRIDFITSFFAPDEVDEIFIVFPDPQPQKPRARKRLTSMMFIERYKQILKKQGVIHLKTDNKGFFDFTLQVIEAQGFELIVASDDIYGKPKNDLIPEIVYETKTHYEKLFLKEGKTMCYLRFKVHE